MNINSANAMGTRIHRSTAQTANHAQSGWKGMTIAKCANSHQTCLTCARIGCLACVGAAAGATLIGPGLGALISTKLTCESVSVGAVSGAILGVYEAAAKRSNNTSQSVQPVITQPQSANQTAIYNKLPVLFEVSSEDEL